MRCTLGVFLGDAAGELDLGWHSYPVYALDSFSDRLKTVAVDEVVVTVESSRLPEIEDLFQLCEEEDVHLRLSLDFSPPRRSVSLERLGTTPLLTLSLTPFDAARNSVRSGTI